MPLSDIQLAAVAEARRLLADVGLTTLPSANDLGLDLHPQSTSSPAGAVTGYLYRPPPARHFTPEELRCGLDCINRQTYVNKIVDHPLGSIIEFPETGPTKDFAIAHSFRVDPSDLHHPKNNIQYSLGDVEGGRAYVECGTLLNGRGNTPAPCFRKSITCKGLKSCSARLSTFAGPPIAHEALDSMGEARKEIFLKTLGLYCTLVEKGCGFDLNTDGDDLGLAPVLDDSEDSECESDSSSCGTQFLKDSRRKKPPRPLCKGKLEVRLDEYGRPFIQCKYRSKSSKTHLILRTLDEFEVPYLRALLENDAEVIHEHEKSARALGYGPLAPCCFTASPSAQKELCPYWHRNSSGKLARGTLERAKQNCSAIFDIYTPYDLTDCPQIVIICRNPHSHHNPFPVKTPPPLRALFNSLLLELDWKLADATPRKLMVESGFMGSFRRHLGWSKVFDPPLSALHPSLGNLDHVRRYINELRTTLFPEGTGFEGAKLLAEEHSKLPEAEQYVRCAETHPIEGGKTFHLVICMLRSMSAHLMASTKLSLDTAFKRLHGKWEEFEMETWDVDQMKSIVGTRAFTTSQSAQAHLILFTRIFEIAFEDTGVPCRFRHIHGEGFQLWIADAHKGQGLGAGMFCQKLCTNLETAQCTMEPPRLLRELDPYDHLRRFYRFCVTHYKRHIHDLRPYTTKEVRNAMLSLSSSEPHPDLEGAFRIIENGGAKAKAWLKDKQVGTKFALPALYQPLSLIPREIWKAAPATTNGNEQAHRNINRDGVDLTMLGGIMRGMQHDFRTMDALALHSSEGIYGRDQTSTHFRRLQRSVNRRVIVQRRVVDKFASGAAEAQMNTTQRPVLAPSSSNALQPPPASERPLFTTVPLLPSIPIPFDHMHPPAHPLMNDSLDDVIAARESFAPYAFSGPPLGMMDWDSNWTVPYVHFPQHAHTDTSGTQFAGPFRQFNR